MSRAGKEKDVDYTIPGLIVIAFSAAEQGGEVVDVRFRHIVVIGGRR